MLGVFRFFRDFDIGYSLLNRRLDDVSQIAPAALWNCSDAPQTGRHPVERIGPLGVFGE